MTDKITLSKVGSLQDTTTAATTINNNFNTIQTAMDKPLWRDGTAPNQMEANFDMNGFQILNLPAPFTANSPVRLQDLEAAGGGTGSGLIVVANIAALRAATSTTIPITNQYITVSGYYSNSDGGQGNFYLALTDTTSLDNGATIVVDASNRRWYRVWDGEKFFAAWAGMFTTTADIGPLFKNVPSYCECWFEPGVYTVDVYPSLSDFSNVFWRGNSTLWNCIGQIGNGTQFDITQIAFQWVYTPPPSVTSITYPGSQNAADMTAAGLSPIEGIGIINQTGVSNGTGLALGGPILINPEGAVRSTTSHSTGKYHVEFMSGSTVGVLGFADSTWDLTSTLGIGANSLVATNFNSGEVVANHSVLTSAGGIDSATPGNWYAMEVDFTAQLVWFCNTTTNPTQWNKSNTANPATGTGGISFSNIPSATQYFVAIQNNSGTVSTVNFGATPFAKTISSGFSAWTGTLNPSDEFQVTLSNGNLSATNAAPPSRFDGSTNPQNYFLRPRNFSIGGFYADIAYFPVVNCFLTGLQNVTLKGGSIGVVYDNYEPPGANSSENILFESCDFVNLGTDGVQLNSFTGSTTFDNCSFDYNHRNGYLNTCDTLFKNCYFETNATSTPAQLWAVDGSSRVVFDSDTIFTGLPYASGDIFQFGGAGSNFAQITLHGCPFYDTHGIGTSGTRQFLNASATDCVYGSIVGRNGTNFCPTVSPASLIQPDYNFASGGLTFYPGSTHATAQSSVTYGGDAFAAALSTTGAATLQTATWDVIPGELLYITMLDSVAGGLGLTSLSGAINFLTADGVAISSPAFTNAPGVSGFVFQNSNLTTGWGIGSSHAFTQHRFIFRVPPGASKGNCLITANCTAGATYYVARFCVYR
jgi:hypothetical protein